MNPNLRFSLFLAAILYPPAAQAIAQAPRRPSPASDRPSHRPLKTDLPDTSPEELLAQRLQHDAQGLRGTPLDGLSPELKQKLRGMLQDEDFLEQLRRRIPPEDFDRLRQKARRGQSLDGDPALADLIRKSVPGGKLSGKDVDALKRWAEGGAPAGREGGNGGAGRQGGRGQAPRRQGRLGGGFAGRPGGLPPAPKPPPSAWERWQERAGRWADKGLDAALKRLEGKFKGEVGSDWRDALGKAARGAVARAPESALRNRAGRLSGYIPRISDRLPANVTDKLIERSADAFSRGPRLGRPASPDLPGLSAPPASGRGTGMLLLWLLVTALALLLALRGRTWYLRQREAAKRWRLGPWPVRPGEVATRDELVRAFEHLALLCLGQAARTCNHLELATRLADRPSTDPDGQRDAAGHLARLYELARYSPVNEPLTREDYVAARRELCLLAGVAA